jgi:DNA polymerase III subunit delta'
MWDVVGHRQAITLLENSLRQGTLAHAYLFTGPRHIGKRTLAINLAQAVNCESDTKPCGQCTPCRRIAAGKHADIHVIDLLSSDKKDIGIDQVRDIQAAAYLPPYEGKRRVFIVEKTELLSLEAANCILKTLEEPLPHVLLILLCSREKILLPTILSRCQRLELRPLPTALVRDTLIQKHGTDRDRAELLARLSGGCPGWAIQALTDATLMDDREERLAALAEVVISGVPERLKYAAALASRFGKERAKVMEILSSWLYWWRDVLMAKSGNDHLLINIDRRETVCHHASTMNIRQIVDFITYLQLTSRYLDQNANPRLALELLMLRIPRTGIAAN